MNRFCPPPALRLFRGHARVIKPALIEEVAVAVRTGSPGCRRDCVDDGGKIALTLLPSLLGTLTLGDVDDGAHEFHQFSGGAEDRMSDGANVSDSGGGVRHAVLKFEVFF